MSFQGPPFSHEPLVGGGLPRIRIVPYQGMKERKMSLECRWVRDSTRFSSFPWPDFPGPDNSRKPPGTGVKEIRARPCAPLPGPGRRFPGMHCHDAIPFHIDHPNRHVTFSRYCVMYCS